jgi:hypothetical protein
LATLLLDPELKGLKRQLVELQAELVQKQLDNLDSLFERKLALDVKMKRPRFDAAPV